MRYLIQFADKTTKRISEDEAKSVIQALSMKQPVVIRGAYFTPHHIMAVKPITKDWFSSDVVSVEENRTELLEGGEEIADRGILPPGNRISRDNEKFLGFTDAKELHNAPSMEKAGAIARRYMAK